MWGHPVVRPDLGVVEKPGHHLAEGHSQQLRPVAARRLRWRPGRGGVGFGDSAGVLLHDGHDRGRAVVGEPRGQAAHRTDALAREALVFEGIELRVGGTVGIEQDAQAFDRLAYVGRRRLGGDGEQGVECLAAYLDTDRGRHRHAHHGRRYAERELTHMVARDLAGQPRVSHVAGVLAQVARPGEGRRR